MPGFIIGPVNLCPRDVLLPNFPTPLPIFAHNISLNLILEEGISSPSLAVYLIALGFIYAGRPRITPAIIERLQAR